MSNKQRNTETTLRQQTETLVRANTVIPVPEGLTLDSEEERTLWRQFTAARPSDEWKRLDLIIVHKCIKLEVRLRNLWEELDGIGYLLENNRGTPVANPLINAIHQIQNQQLAMIRTLQLTELSLSTKAERDRKAKAEDHQRQLAASGELELLAHTDPMTGETLYEANS